MDIINSWQDLEQGSMGDWSRLNTFCLRKDLTDPANYNEVLSQISLDGFIDYYIARAYSGDRDYCNIRVCRSRAGDRKAGALRTPGLHCMPGNREKRQGFHHGIHRSERRDLSEAVFWI